MKKSATLWITLWLLPLAARLTPGKNRMNMQ